MQAESSSFRVRRLPRPGRHAIDRRRNRSEDAGTAITLAYSCSAQRAGLDVMLLVDEAGMVVAQSRTDLDLSMLAAVTPIVGRGQATPRIRRDGRKREMSVRSIELLGERMYVAAVGGDIFARNREMHRSLAATQRILA